MSPNEEQRNEQLAARRTEPSELLYYPDADQANRDFDDDVQRWLEDNDTEKLTGEQNKIANDMKAEIKALFKDGKSVGTSEIYEHINRAIMDLNINKTLADLGSKESKLNEYSKKQINSLRERLLSGTMSEEDRLKELQRVCKEIVANDQTPRKGEPTVYYDLNKNGEYKSSGELTERLLAQSYFSPNANGQLTVGASFSMNKHFYLQVIEIGTNGMPIEVALDGFGGSHTFGNLDPNKVYAVAVR